MSGLTRTEKLKRDISVIFGRARLGALDGGHCSTIVVNEDSI